MCQCAPDSMTTEASSSVSFIQAETGDLEVAAADLSRLVEDLDTFYDQSKTGWLGQKSVKVEPMAVMLWSACRKNEVMRLAALRVLEAYCRRNADKHAADTIVAAKAYRCAPWLWNDAILESLHMIAELHVHSSSDTHLLHMIAEVHMIARTASRRMA